MRNPTLTAYKAFTLIELLLAMLISSILVLGINAAYQQAHMVWSNAEHYRPIYNDLRLITGTLRRELAGLYLPGPPDANDAENPPADFQPITVEQTALIFYTLTPTWHSSLISARIAKVRYEFKTDKATGESILTRFEQPYAAEKPIGKETSDLVAVGLSDFNVTAAAKEENAADPNENTAPKTLNLSLKWPAKDNFPELLFHAVFPIPARRPLKP